MENLLEPEEKEISTLKRRSKIRQAFSRAASHYDESANVQRRIGEALLNKVTVQPKMRVLDLGCGTGFISEKLLALGAEVVCFDLSENMLVRARERCRDHAVYLAGDANHLPFGEHSFDLVFSSLMLQWCTDLSGVFSEIKRVLKPCGQVAFSTLLEGTLFELSSSWEKVDQGHHVNVFNSLQKTIFAVEQAGFHAPHILREPFVEFYLSAFALMKDLKGIGANHLNHRPQGLRGRQTLKQLEVAYQAYRDPSGGLPASYQVGFGVLNV